MEDFFDEDFDWSDDFAEAIDNTTTDVEKAHKKRPSPPRKKQRLSNRQFPGPAGILPMIEVDSKEKALKLSKIKHPTPSKNDDDQITLSQIQVICSEEDELGLTREELIDDNKAWEAIKKDSDFTQDYFKYNSEYIKRQAKMSGSSIKVPLFCSVIKSIDISSGLDPACQLIDSHGVVSGQIHREVIRNYGDQLKPGKIWNSILSIVL